MSEELDQLVSSHTRDELDALATEAGVEDPESLANKEEVAQAILDAGGDNTPPEEAPAEDATEEASAEEEVEVPESGGPETIAESPQTPEQLEEEVSAAPAPDGALNQDKLPGGADEAAEPDETEEERVFRLTFENIPEDDDERRQTAQNVWDSQKALEEKINSLPGYIDGA